MINKLNHINLYNFNRVTPSFNGGQNPTPPLANDAFFSTNNNEHMEHFFPGGMEKIKIFQAGVGNCQFLASIDALAHNKKGVEILKKVIHPKDAESLTFTFQKYPNKQIYVNNDEHASYDLVSRMCEFVVQAIELNSPGVYPLTVAYAKLMRDVYPEKFDSIKDKKICSIYDNKKYHSSASEVLSDITGLPVKTIGISDKKPQKDFISFEEQGPKAKKDAENILNEYSQNPDKYVLTACSKNSKKFYADKEKKIPHWHDFSIRNVDLKNRMVILANPQDASKTLDFSYEKFLNYFSSISVLDINPAF